MRLFWGERGHNSPTEDMSYLPFIFKPCSSEETVIQYEVIIQEQLFMFYWWYIGYLG